MVEKTGEGRLPYESDWTVQGDPSWEMMMIMIVKSSVPQDKVTLRSPNVNIVNSDFFYDF